MEFFTSLKETLELVGLMMGWALVSVVFLPLWPFAAPALREWFGVRAAPDLETA